MLKLSLHTMTVAHETDNLWSLLLPLLLMLFTKIHHDRLKTTNQRQEESVTQCQSLLTHTLCNPPPHVCSHSRWRSVFEKMRWSVRGRGLGEALNVESEPYAGWGFTGQSAPSAAVGTCGIWKWPSRVIQAAEWDAESFALYVQLLTAALSVKQTMIHSVFHPVLSWITKILWNSSEILICRRMNLELSPLTLVSDLSIRHFC